MAKVPIHFMGLLANVDDSITRLRLSDGFTIEKKTRREILPFEDRIRFQYGFTAALPLALNAATGCFCIAKRVVTEFEGSGVEIADVVREWPVADTAEFTLTDAEIPEAPSFIQKYSRSFNWPSRASTCPMKSTTRPWPSYRG